MKTRPFSPRGGRIPQTTRYGKTVRVNRESVCPQISQMTQILNSCAERSAFSFSAVSFLASGYTARMSCNQNPKRGEEIGGWPNAFKSGNDGHSPNVHCFGSSFSQRRQDAKNGIVVAVLFEKLGVFASLRDPSSFFVISIFISAS